MKSGARHREHNELCSYKSDPNFIAPLTPADLWVTPITKKETLDGTLSHLMRHPWVVYCKSALEYRKTLVSYLARYTYRVGLSNHRLESWKDNQVALSYFDNKANKASRLSLEPAELIRRFLLHILFRVAQRIYAYSSLWLFIECHKKACLRKDQTTE